MYLAAQVANTGLGVLVYGLLTRVLTVAEFGAYNVVFAFYLFTSVFFDFGLASSALRLAALAEDEDARRRRSGALLLCSGGLGLAYMLFVVGAAPVVDRYFAPGLGGTLLLLAPLVVAFPVQEMLQTLAQGSGRIVLLSALLLLPRVLLLAILGVLALRGGFGMTEAAGATLAATLLSCLAGVAALRPRFARLRAQAGEIRRELREFGRHMYAGRAVDAFTTGLDKLLLSSWHGAAAVGPYAIALTMASPLSMLSRSSAVTRYRRFAREDRIGPRLVIALAGWSVAGAVLLLLAGAVLVPLFFTHRYVAALPLLPLLALGAVLAGLNQPFHSFLGAQRQGRSIRIMSVSTSLLNVGLNLLLIPQFAAQGAALATAGSYSVNLGLNAYYYRKFRREHAAE